MGQIFERRPVDGVRAALDLHVHRRAAGHPLLRIEAVGDDVHRFDGFDRGGVGLQALDPLVRGADAVEPEDRVGIRRAVDGHLHRPRRVVDTPGLEEVRLLHARRQRQRALEAAAVDRQVLQLLAGRLRLHRSRFRLEQDRVGGHHHRLLQRADGQPRIDANGGVEPHGDVLRAERLKARQRHLDAVGAGGDVRKVIPASFIAGRVARLVRLHVRNRDRRTRHRQVGGIGDGSDDRAIEHLRACIRRPGGDREGYQDRHELHFHRSS